MEVRTRVTAIYIYIIISNIRLAIVINIRLAWAIVINIRLATVIMPNLFYVYSTTNTGLF